MSKKLFILDTNVLIHDPSCLFAFENNDLMIPIIVLEELDHLKNGNEWRNQSARSVIRTLNNLPGPPFKLGKGHGTLTIAVDGYDVRSKSPIFDNLTQDNKILSLCYNQYNDNKNVVFITKDINLRMKAKALGLTVQDYENDKVGDPNKLYTGYRVLNAIGTDAINEAYANGHVENLVSDPVANEYFLLKNNKQSAILYFNPETQIYELVKEQSAAGIKPKNFEQIITLDLLSRDSVPLVALTGTSGAGKTLLTLASGISQKSKFLNIYLSRPIVPVGKDIGFLPGDWKEKIEPFMAPLWDNLEVIKKEAGNKKLIEEMLLKEKIQVAALPYLRGRSLPRIFFQIDEGQNSSPHEMKTIITRAGEGTKMVITGDINQIDAPYLDSRSNGLSHLINKMKGQSVFGHIKLQKGERSKLAELASNLL